MFEPFSFLLKNSTVFKAESIQATCRWVRNSSDILEWRFNSSEYITISIKSNHIRKGIERISVYPTQRVENLSYCLHFGPVSSHNSSGWKEAQEVSSPNSWLKHGQLWDHTAVAQGLIQTLFENLQERRSHSCLSKQSVPKPNYSQWKSFPYIHFEHTLF